ncbi:hypothetical protein [Zobellella aerophila]|uniref:Uncharacterized protein n=1 Tax=Zobellella aerophila TaxID=870480 RepID=A0ABP6W5G1_9GAMM
MLFRAKEAVAGLLERPLHEMEESFHWLQQDGIVYRKPNRHFALNQ